MQMTEKDVFIQLRSSRRDRDLLKAMATKRGLDSSKLVMKWYRKELKRCKAEALDAGVTLDTYLSLNKKQRNGHRRPR